MDDETSVRVALRIRPQIAREKIEICRICTSVTPGEPQVVLGSDKAFTFDYVYDMDSSQEKIYDTCVSSLLEGCFDGYNATVLAYGQTGSGKTYTMGTGFDDTVTPDYEGIIPRAVKHIFDGIRKRKMDAIDNESPEPFFQVSVQFIELYREEILDLLDPTRDVEASRSCKSNIRIHEDHRGNIYMTDVVSRQVNSAEETMNVLRDGALTRTTAKTNMNAQSSRSHAIFSILISQQRFFKPDINTQMNGQGESEFETLTAKFHFVDLAGSERLKRTGATGIRAEEGININCGLLALGNVISALGDASQKISHVPYRDSKLTRLLQDSLGGNSRTTMIACISPSDCDFLETLNTLKYANRARNIKNKVMVNQDRSSRVISDLRARIQALEMELAEYKQGKRIATADGGETVNDMYHENMLLQTELNQLRLRVKAMQESQEVLRARNTDLLCEMETRSLKIHRTSDIGANSEETENGHIQEDDQLKSLIRKYLEEIEDLRTKLCESESASQMLRQQVARYKTTVQNQQRFNGGIDGFAATLPGSMISSPNGMTMSLNGTSIHGDDIGSISPLVDAAKADIERLRAKTKELKHHDTNGRNGQGNGADGQITDENDASASSDVELEKDDSDDSESDEKEEELSKYRQDLADLQCEITLKERLVEELVQSQKRLQAVRMQYEEKLAQLQLRIQDTEMERDRVLSALEQKHKFAGERADEKAAVKIKKDYEERINSLRSEMKRLQVAQKEHQRLARELQQNQTQISRLSSEVQEMKKAKVALMQKMKEESSKARMSELRRQKELAQLQKEARRRENELRELKLREQRREAVLKRKQEEMQSLRRAQRPGSSRNLQQQNGSQSTSFGSTNERTHVNNGRSVVSNCRRRSDRIQSRVAKLHWISIEKTITSQVTKKQTISHMEQELERCMKNRDESRRKLEALRQKKANISETGSVQMEAMNKSVLADLDEQIDGLQANIDYFQDQIADCQKQIMDVEEGTKDDSESQEAGESLFENCQSMDEAKYLLEHLFNLCVAQGSLAAEKQASLQDIEIKLQQTQQEFKVHQKLLQHLINSNPEVCGIPENMVSSVESMSGSMVLPTSGSSCTSAPVVNHSIAIDKMDDNSNHERVQDRIAREKARRRTATPEELLYSETSIYDPIRPPLNVVFELDDAQDEINNCVDQVDGTNGSRTRDCSPDDSLGRISSAMAHVGVGRSNSCVEVRERAKLMLPPPVPPKRNGLKQAEYGSTRTNALRRKNIGEPSYESDHEAVSIGPASMTVSDTVVQLRRVMNSDQAPMERQLNTGSAQSVAPFARGHANRSTIAGSLVADNMTNRKVYGGRNHASKGNGTDPGMKKSAAVASVGMPVVSTSAPVVAPGASAYPPTITVSSTVSNGGSTPPASPRVLRRQMHHMNVFSRLTSAAATNSFDETAESDSQPSHGFIHQYESQKKNMFRDHPLKCVYVAEGHGKAVLTVSALDSMMATGSKDRSAKVWDLETRTETASFPNHPNNVQCVRLHPSGNLLFSVSMGQVKVWDLRSSACVKTLSSSGLTIDGECSPGSGNDVLVSSNRQTTLGQNEAMIAQIDFTPDSNYLMTAAYNQIRVWDLRNYAAVGKLSNATSTPKSELSCMKIIPSSHSNFRVAAGSRDHFIKIFNLSSSTPLQGSFEPYQQLDPPHYDGITCLASCGEDGRWLFSGSRDQCLAKWDLANGGQRVQWVQKAHKAWILSMTFLPPPFESCLATSCREGCIRLWDTVTCKSVGGFLSHASPVNHLTTNNRFIFSASADSTVGLWVPRKDVLDPKLTS